MLQAVPPTLRKILLPVLLLTSLLAVTAGITAPRAAAATTVSDAVVYVGQEGASVYEQSLDGVLYTENSIGVMADRILATESEIGEMADRIVYVTEVSQYTGLTVVYYAYDVTLTGIEEAGYLYELSLVPVAALPTGW
ncbi:MULTISPECIES: hypothetical protein [Streptomyces]|uniref:hypothetical protein n=1 Tax=Streptomyces TaxID=1883 RepID=UPI000A9F71B9|nr:MULTISPECIES: hypothetical protein [Streptomyces]